MMIRRRYGRTEVTLLCTVAPVAASYLVSPLTTYRQTSDTEGTIVALFHRHRRLAMANGWGAPRPRLGAAVSSRSAREAEVLCA